MERISRSAGDAGIVVASPPALLAADGGYFGPGTIRATMRSDHAMSTSAHVEASYSR
jgi:hypothetical protein